MCLTSTKNRMGFTLFGKTVYKVLIKEKSGVLYSPVFRDKMWREGYLERESVKNIYYHFNYYDVWSFGFHSFLIEKEAIRYKYKVEFGIEQEKDKERKEYLVFEARIPAFSRIVLGEKKSLGQILSNRLIIKRILQ